MNFGHTGTMQIRNLTLIPYQDASRDSQLKILEWRNHSSVREMFIQQEVIDEETHFNFIRRLGSDPTRLYWVVRYREEDAGSIDFYNIGDTDAWWGFFLAPRLQQSALGVLMEFVVLEIAFQIMELECLRCETRVHNTSVLKLHRQFGFEETKTENGLVVMAIHKNSWLSSRHDLEQLVEMLLR